MPLPIVREELPDEDYRASLWLGRNKGDGTLRHHKLFKMPLASDLISMDLS